MRAAAHGFSSLRIRGHRARMVKKEDTATLKVDTPAAGFLPVRIRLRAPHPSNFSVNH